MIIELPVTIVWDWEGNRSLGKHRRLRRTFTVRMSTQDDAGPLTYCTEYPPRENSRWQVDHGVLSTLLSNEANSEICMRAVDDPEGYEPQYLKE
jgi:hypothetical protein